MNILNRIEIITGIPGSLIGVKVIPNTVLVLITWRQIENNDEFPVKNITIRYKIMDDRNSRDDWNVLQVNPSKVKTICG